jgi:hypothetical protein
MRYLVMLFLAASIVVAAGAEPDDALADKSATLTPQSGEGRDIRSVFNENVDRVRLMVLLSPT